MHTRSQPNNNKHKSTQLNMNLDIDLLLLRNFLMMPRDSHQRTIPKIPTLPSKNSNGSGVFCRTPNRAVRFPSACLCCAVHWIRMLISYCWGCFERLFLFFVE
uniref:Uncharacterized protein n=1 Tax=Proboscia inermis TaxID=420281 RepID=A0A7S0GIW6_9STRA